MRREFFRLGDGNKFHGNSTFDQTPNEQTENIFMTEVRSNQREKVLIIPRFFFQFENEDNYPNVVPMDRPKPPEPQGLAQPRPLPDEKFKGFEAFLDIDNEKDITVPHSQSSSSFSSSKLFSFIQMSSIAFVT